MSALAGIKIADFSRVLAGPYATMLLGDMGAEVIKIERPATGDDTRTWGPPFTSDGDSTYFQSVNRNKIGVTADLTTDLGRAKALEIISKCDVLVENFTIGTMEKFGLGYEELHKKFPKLIYCQISGFGTSMAAAKLPGYDLLVQGMSGLMSITGADENSPTKVGVALVDVISGLHAALGISAALVSRAKSGVGQKIEINLLSSALSAMVNQSAAFAGAGVTPKAMGNAHPSIAPYDSTKFRELIYDTNFDPDNIISEEQKKRGTINFLFQNYIKVKSESKEIGLSSVDLINGTLNNIKKFKSGLTYEDITPEFLHSFEHWYIHKNLPEGKKNSLASFGGLCRNIKAVINYHRKKKIIPLTYEYPFDDYKIPNFVPPKRVISNVEIQKILDCEVFENVMEEYARDIWEMLYRLNGINFIDLLKLRWDNIESNRFVFYRHKTLKTRRNNIRPIEVVINQKVQKLLDKIGDKYSPYVIGQIKQVNYSDQYLLERNKKLKGRYNTRLKKLGQRLGLSLSLDISMARDAYANTHKRAGTNLLQISESMNHSDPRTTTLHYLDNFEFDSDVDVNDVLL